MRFENIYLTVSQKRLVEKWLSELSIKLQKDEAKILEGILSDNFFTSKKHDNKIQGEYFFNKLYELRNPELTAALKKFKDLEDNLFKDYKSLKKDISIKPSKYFEKEEIVLNIRVTKENLPSISDLLRKKQEVLNKMIDII